MTIRPDGGPAFSMRTEMRDRKPARSSGAAADEAATGEEEDTEDRGWRLTLADAHVHMNSCHATTLCGVCARAKHTLDSCIILGRGCHKIPVGVCMPTISYVSGSHITVMS